MICDDGGYGVDGGDCTMLMMVRLMVVMVMISCLGGQTTGIQKSFHLNSV